RAARLPGVRQLCRNRRAVGARAEQQRQTRDRRTAPDRRASGGASGRAISRFPAAFLAGGRGTGAAIEGERRPAAPADIRAPDVQAGPAAVVATVRALLARRPPARPLRPADGAGRERALRNAARVLFGCRIHVAAGRSVRAERAAGQDVSLVRPPARAANADGDAVRRRGAGALPDDAHGRAVLVPRALPHARPRGGGAVPLSGDRHARRRSGASGYAGPHRADAVVAERRP